jgi:hypothetical protein
VAGAAAVPGEPGAQVRGAGLQASAPLWICPNTRVHQIITGEIRPTSAMSVHAAMSLVSRL